MSMYSNPNLTFGRDKIYTYEKINKNTVIRIVKSSLNSFNKNVQDIEWTFDLYRGKDSRILSNGDERSEINHKVIVSQESAIVDVKAGLLTQNPVTLINRTGDESKNDSINKLSNIYKVINKHRIDKECAGQAGICGTSYVFTEKDPLYKKDVKNGHYPFKKSILNPTSVFPLWEDTSDNEPIAMVYVTQEPKDDVVNTGDITGEPKNTGLIKRYTVYTDKFTYSFTENDEEPIVKNAMPWGIPIVEKYCNPYRIGFFERVESLIYARSVLRSDELTNISNFVNAMWFMRGLSIPEVDINADEKTRAKQQKAQDDFLLKIKKTRMIWSPDSKDKNESGIELVGKQIDNEGTQTLDETLRNDIITLAKVPDYVANIGGSGNNGAAQTSSGWLPALLDAIDQQPYWFEGLNKELYIELSICQEAGMFEDLTIEDIEFNIQRKTFDDKQSSAQTFTTLKNAGVPWAEAIDISNITHDSQNLASKMMKWREEEEARGEVIGKETTEEIITEDEPNETQSEVLENDTRNS